jgi:6-bladed beta-propeller
MRTFVFLAMALVPASVTAQLPQVFKQPDLVYERAFSRITGIHEYSDGRILIADDIEKVVAVLDPDGSGVRVVGREGRGPGEYSELNVLLDMPGDSALLLDRRLLRYSVIGPGENIDRTFQVASSMESFFQSEVSAQTPKALGQNGGVYYDLAGIIKRRNGNIVSGDRTPVLRLWPLSNVLDTVGYMSVPNLEERWLASPVSRMFDPGESGFALFNMDRTPFAGQDSWGVLPNGTVVVAKVNDYHLEFWRNGALVRSGPHVPDEPVAVTRSDREIWLDNVTRGTQGGSGTFSTDGGGRRAVPRAAPGNEDFVFPDFKPPFPSNGLKVGGDGMIWVQRFVSTGGDTEIDVFSDTGERIYQVVLPPDRTLLAVTARYIYALRYTVLEEQIIERYPM